MRDDQILQIREIASTFKNLKCVECVRAIQDYLMAEGIHGKRIKLYTGSTVRPNNYIYDDTVPGEAISENGRHEGIAVVINATEIVFDNHHPEGIPRDEWMENLQFHAKIMNRRQFQVTEADF